MNYSVTVTYDKGAEFLNEVVSSPCGETSPFYSQFLQDGICNEPTVSIRDVSKQHDVVCKDRLTCQRSACSRMLVQCSYWLMSFGNPSVVFFVEDLRTASLLASLCLRAKIYLIPLQLLVLETFMPKALLINCCV